MELRDRLRIVLRRLELSARELELQPEAFQATAEIQLAAGDLAAVIQDLDSPGKMPAHPGGNVSGVTQMQSSNRGTGLALARLRYSMAA